MKSKTSKGRKGHNLEFDVLRNAKLSSMFRIFIMGVKNILFRKCQMWQFGADKVMKLILKIKRLL